MTTQLQSQSLVHRADYYQDGLIDIALGLTALCFGATIWSEVIFPGWLLPAALTPSWIAIRKATLRRMGLESDSPANPAGQRGLFMGLVLSMLFLLLGMLVFLLFNLGIAADLRTWLYQYFPMALGVFAAALLALTGLILGLQRFYAYAGLLVLLVASGYLFNLSFEAGLLIFGGLVLLSGISLLMRFLSQH